MRFPRGLSQPAPGQGFRFSVDALLLAAFAARFRPRVIFDVGTGCGVVALGLARLLPEARFLGLDIDFSVLEHARGNAREFAERVVVVQGDVRQLGCRPGCCDAVVCNPPYRNPETGRLSAAKCLGARFETVGTLEDFVRAASWVVNTRGACFFVHLAERVDELLAMYTRWGIQAKDLCFVHPRFEEKARLVLVRGIKNGGAGLTVHAPLILHVGTGKNTHLSEQALEFCPWLACNSEPELT